LQNKSFQFPAGGSLCAAGPAAIVVSADVPARDRPLLFMTHHRAGFEMTEGNYLVSVFPFRKSAIAFSTR
jgi:hypothetical protein